MHYSKDFQRSCRKTSTVPGTSIGLPGRIFDPEKNKPVFYLYFQDLCDSFGQEIQTYKSTIEGLFNADDENEEVVSITDEEKIEKGASLIELAQKLLLHYGIPSQIFSEKSDFQGTLSLLRTLLEEICSFPKEFIKKLEILGVHIYSRRNSISFESQISFGEKEQNTILSLFTGEQEIIPKLYKVIFMGLVKTNHDILGKWKAFLSKYSLGSGIDSLQGLTDDLERVFYSAMGCKKQTLLTQKIRKFKRLLVKLNSECITDRWLKGKLNKTIKSAQHVSFDYSPDVNRRVALLTKEEKANISSVLINHFYILDIL